MAHKCAHVLCITKPEWANRNKIVYSFFHSACETQKRRKQRNVTIVRLLDAHADRPTPQGTRCESIINMPPKTSSGEKKQERNFRKNSPRSESSSQNRPVTILRSEADRIPQVATAKHLSNVRFVATFTSFFILFPLAATVGANRGKIS